MSLAGYDLAGFARFCKRLILPNGRRFSFEPFQNRMLEDFFNGAIETLIVIPKKNGKTTLLAALGVYHLLTHPDANVLIVASARDQARLMFNEAARLIRRSGLDNQLEIKTGYGLIWPRGKDSAGPHMAIKPAAPETVDGVIPTLALIDELHRHRTAELYTILRDGLLGDAQMVTISTAGSDQENPLWAIREKIRAYPAFIREGSYNYSRSPDGNVVMHEWCLDNTDDLTDMELVKAANPASWHTVPSLRARFESPKMTPATWARFACNVWIFGESPWIDAPTWDFLGVGKGIQQGDRVWAHASAGVGGWAIVVAAPAGEASVIVQAFVSGEDSLEAVETALLELDQRYDLREVSFDAQEFRRSGELLVERGLPMVEIPHSAERLSIASVTLHRLVQAKLLQHNGDPRLREQVLRGTTKETERGWRLVKDPRARALIALAMACHQATALELEPPMVIAL